MSPLSLFSRSVFQAYRWTVRPVCRRLWGLEVSGGEHIRGRGPLIVAANHASLLDAFVLIAALDIPIRYVITWDFYGPLSMRWIFWSLGTIPIGGKVGLLRSFRRVGEFLDRGGIAGVFPEGRISLDGALQPFQSGVATLACRHGATILPVYIEGSFEAMPRWARWPRVRPIRIRVGESIEPPRRGEATAASIRALTGRLEASVTALAQANAPASRLRSPSSV